MINAKLVVVGGESADRELNLNLPSIIGRGRDASLTVQHSLVSRLHCEIYEREGRLFVRDLQSLNGTYINNFKIIEEEPLLPGQLLTLGNMTFRACYELDGAACGQGPSAHPAPSTDRQCVDTVQSVAAEPYNADPYNEDKFVTVPGKPAHESVEHMTTPTIGVSAASSDILDGIQFLSHPKKSVSVSALGNLPGAPPAVSFVGNFDGARPVAEADTDDLDVDVKNAPARKTVQADDSALNSFVRKLPR